MINPDEFEEIAEIYDSLRALHASRDPSRDLFLAQDFDNKLKTLMESLSQTLQSALNPHLKKERTLTAKFDLLSICSDKICDYLAVDKRLASVVGAVIDGLRGVYLELQDKLIEVVREQEVRDKDLERGRMEMEQLLIAAEELEKERNRGRGRIKEMEKDSVEMCKRIQELEEDNKKYLDTIIRHSKGYDTKELVQDLQH